MAKRTRAVPCPCGSGQSYEHCCGPYHHGAQLPGQPELLMRARYSAYCRQDEAFLRATWHPDTRPDTLDLETAPCPQWIGLDILSHRSPEFPQAGDEGWVCFIARFRIQGRGQKLHENSRFIWLLDLQATGLEKKGRWYYVDGEIFAGN